MRCAGCGEIAYCSKECQKSDWKRHKVECGDTDKIDLGTFYPFLAILVDYGHQIAQRNDFPSLNHPALTHRIINNANPGVPFSIFADGWKGILVKLGDPMPRMDPILTTKDWWPQARSLPELNKLRARIRREGNVVPILFGLCVALVDILYTTTYNKERGQTRVRLHFRQSPVVDFGICTGPVRVAAQDRLAYLLPDGSCIQGQDPDNHYWIYFLTARGEEFVLDCSMFTFNLDWEAKNEPYILDDDELLTLFPASPAWTESRDLDLPKQLPRRSDCVRERFSVLRHPSVQRAFQNSESFEGKPLFLMDLFPLMDEIADRQCSFPEQEFLISHTAWCSSRLYQIVLRTKEWKAYPKDVIMQYGLDADGRDPVVEGEKKWTKLKKEEKKERRKAKEEQRKGDSQS